MISVIAAAQDDKWPVHVLIFHCCIESPLIAGCIGIADDVHRIVDAGRGREFLSELFLRFFGREAEVIPGRMRASVAMIADLRNWSRMAMRFPLGRGWVEKARA